MNASAIIYDSMTLEENLAAIESAMAAAQEQANEEARSNGFAAAAPLDPADLTMCEGCQ